jgi:hypothetical protein
MVGDMRRPAHHVRLLLAFLATVQVAAPPAAALADAAFADGAQWLGLHIEDHGAGRRDHPPHRDDCVFCQFLGQHAVASQPGVRVRIASLVASFAIETPNGPGLARVYHLPDSRAPPTA